MVTMTVVYDAPTLSDIARAFEEEGCVSIKLLLIQDEVIRYDTVELSQIRDLRYDSATGILQFKGAEIDSYLHESYGQQSRIRKEKWREVVISTKTEWGGLRPKSGIIRYIGPHL